MVTVIEPLLGTRAELSIAGPDAVALEQSVVGEARRLEAIFTRFDPDSEFRRFIRTGSTEVLELQEVLSLASHWRERTGGWFEPAMGSLMQSWDDAERLGRAPDDAELVAVVELRRGSPDDLHAIAKGWIVERALHHGLDLTDDPSLTAWFNVGGDVLHRGPGSVRVGIEDPARPYDNAPPLARIDLTNEALATSGGARRWWNVAGVRVPKLLDPRTGRPVDHVRSASVVAADAATADVLATVAVVAPVDETVELLAAHGAEGLLVLASGEVRSTSDRFET